MKKLLLSILVLLLLTGCTNSNNPSKEEETKKEYVSKEYEEIVDECVIYYANKEAILSMLKNGTGIVFLSWNGCPWCHGYINYVNSTALEADLDVMYFDIYEDRNNNTDFYKEIVDLIKDYVDSYAYVTNGETKAAYDADGNVRIYVPTVIYVVKGEIIGMDYQGSMESDWDNNGDNFWSENINGVSRSQALLENMRQWSNKVKEVRKEIEESGCDKDTACEL